MYTYVPVVCQLLELVSAVVDHQVERLVAVSGTPSVQCSERERERESSSKDACFCSISSGTLTCMTELKKQVFPRFISPCEMEKHKLTMEAAG